MSTHSRLVLDLGMFAATFLERLRHTSRLNLVVDAMLFVSSVAVMLGGLVISRISARPGSHGCGERSVGSASLEDRRLYRRASRFG